MELLPILIIVGGIIYSTIASRANKEKEGQRNIDPSKMERRSNSAPRRRQPENRDESSGSKGIFEDLKREFKREYDKAMGTEEERPSGRQSETTRRAEESRRMQQEAEKKIKEVQNSRSVRNSSGERNKRDFQKNNRGYRTEHSRRAAESKQAVYSEGYSRNQEPRKEGRESGIGRDVADQVRYQYGDDRTQSHKRNKSGKKHVTKKDLSFDQRAVVNGIIFSEILGKPKSRR